MTSMEFPKISVVTPSFNQGQFLEETIRSVVEQKYPNLEYLIIDGGSEDESVEIIRRYESQLTFWVSEPDGGQTEAINKGLRRATGEIFAYLCSDDVYLPGTLAKVAQLFVERPEVDVIYGDCHFTNERGIVTRSKRPGPFDRRRLLWNNYLYQPSVFLRASAVQRHGEFDESLAFGMDYEYWLRLSSDCRFLYVPMVMSCYRLHSVSKSMAGVVNMMRENVVIKRRYGRATQATLYYWYFRALGQYYYRTKRYVFDRLASWKGIER